MTTDGITAMGRLIPVFWGVFFKIDAWVICSLFATKRQLLLTKPIAIIIYTLKDTAVFKN